MNNVRGFSVLSVFISIAVVGLLFSVILRVLTEQVPPPRSDAITVPIEDAERTKAILEAQGQFGG